MVEKWPYHSGFHFLTLNEKLLATLHLCNWVWRIQCFSSFGLLLSFLSQLDIYYWATEQNFIFSNKVRQPSPGAMNIECPNSTDALTLLSCWKTLNINPPKHKNNDKDFSICFKPLIGISFLCGLQQRWSSWRKFFIVKIIATNELNSSSYIESHLYEITAPLTTSASFITPLRFICSEKCFHNCETR